MSTAAHNLFSIPLELRRLIYTQIWAPKLRLHIFLEDGQPRVSPCLGANLGEEEFNSRNLTREERARLDPLARGCGRGQYQEWTRRYITRLQSSWGPHYRCEEVPKGGTWLGKDHPGMQTHNCIGMLLVCRQMNTECIDLVREQLQVHVTDLDTALYIVNRGLVDSDTPIQPPSCPASITSSTIFQHIRSLSICLYTEPEVYHELSTPEPPVPNGTATHNNHEEENGQEGSDMKTRAVAVSKHQMWRLIWPGLASLPHLKSLSIWLDHSAQTWSEIDERALLEPLCRTVWRPQVDITVHMPNVRRDRIQPERHFSIDDDEDLCFRICRRRRRYEVAPPGTSCHVIAPDVEDALRTEEYGTFIDLDYMEWHECGYGYYD